MEERKGHISPLTGKSQGVEVLRIHCFSSEITENIATVIWEGLI